MEDKRPKVDPNQILADKYVVEGASPGHIAELYDKSLVTLSSWIKPIRDRLGPRTSLNYTPKQVRMIFDHCGWPYDKDL